MEYRPVNLDRKYNTKRSTRVKQLAQAIELAGALYRNQAKSKHKQQQQQHHHNQQQNQFNNSNQPQHQNQQFNNFNKPSINNKKYPPFNDNRSSINNDNISYYIDHHNLAQRQAIKVQNELARLRNMPLVHQPTNYVHKVVPQPMPPQPAHFQQTPICVIQRQKMQMSNVNYNLQQTPLQVSAVKKMPQQQPQQHQPFVRQKFNTPYQFWNPFNDSPKQPSVFRHNNENISRMFDQTVYRTNRLFWTKVIILLRVICSLFSSSLTHCIF